MTDRELAPPDEDVPDQSCARTDPHQDHYWRTDGRRFRYLDEGPVRYCPGVPRERSLGVVTAETNEFFAEFGYE